MIRTNYGTNFQLLLIIFIRSLPNSIYLTVISLLDCLLCIVYILLFGIDASLVFLKNETLFIAYHTYIIPVFIISRITQFAMPYMLILATFERFLWTVGKRTRLSPFLHFLIDFFLNFLLNCYFRERLLYLCSIRGKYISVTLVILISIILRSPIVYAIEVCFFLLI